MPYSVLIGIFNYINMEVWEKVIGYENYEVSNLGNVKTLKRNYWNGRGWCVRKEKLIKIQFDTNYSCVGLYKKDSLKGKTILLHRIVAIAFIPNPDNKPCVNHIDGNKRNNNVDNLEWCTHSENTKHACRTGLILPTNGEINGMSRLTEKDILEIRGFEKGTNQRLIAEKYNVTRNTICSIINRRAWKHI